MPHLLIFLLEEQSMKVTLESLLPRLIPEESGVSWKLLAHQGKTDLEKSIPRKTEANCSESFQQFVRGIRSLLKTIS